MKRRTFLANTSAATTLIGLGGIPLGSCSNLGRKHITILHTNDVHSHIDPFPATHSKYPNMGGVARRANLVEQIRQENPNTLLLDAGDIFQGTPYFNFYGGELEIKLMSMLRYDAATLGNHDFDNGIDGLLAQMPHAGFPMINANYDFSNTVMDGLVKPYGTFTLEGVKVGVYGLGIALEGLVTKRLYRETVYLDPLEIALDMERKLREEENCHLVICLSHLGHSYGKTDRPSDVRLAKATQSTDLIIGGHTHTFLERPDVFYNQRELPVLVNQVGCFGLRLGRIDFYLDSAHATAKGVNIEV